MIRGRVSLDLEPWVPIVLHGSNPKVIQAIVDTGFSGHLLLARKQRRFMRLSYFGREIYEYADGRTKPESIYLGRVTFNGQGRIVLVLLTNSTDTLVGASLLKNMDLLVSYRNRRVVIR